MKRARIRQSFVLTPWPARPNVPQTYFRIMTSMGPACTSELRHARKFPTAAEALQSPAMRWPGAAFSATVVAA